ncbi:MAG: hypothetical protein JXR43_11450 [Burkholderiaceae bacterium]|jgi:hypothetical protein|nr:hypothetical protein [Burkholderiaceae bacterium]
MRSKFPWAIALFWAVVLALLVLDWRAGTPHDRFAEPPPLALGNGPAADAGHCSLAPSSR